MEKVCKTYSISDITGKCAKQILSKKKGEPCSTNEDCVTSDSNTYA